MNIVSVSAAGAERSLLLQGQVRRSRPMLASDKKALDALSENSRSEGSVSTST